MTQQPVALSERCGLPNADGTGSDPAPAPQAPQAAGSTATLPLDGTLPAPYQALLVLPICVHDGVYGCLLLFYTQPCRFSDEEIAVAQAYVDQAALAITNARLQAHLEQAAAAAERNRLARDLHDTVAQELFTSRLLAYSLPRVWETQRAEAEATLQQLHDVTQSAYAGLRALHFELRPTVLEHVPLMEALQQLGTILSRRAGVPIAVVLDSSAGTEPPLPAAVKVAFYRVAQEALTNAAKYAKSQAIRVRLRACGRGQGRRLELEIRDDGQGFDLEAVPAGHFGLAMMRERAQAVGAWMEVRSGQGEGTQITVTWRGRRQVAAAAPGQEGAAADA